MNRHRSREAAARVPWLRVAVLISVWVALFSYAGRPILVAAHATGVAPHVAWIALVLLSIVPLLPFFTRSRSKAHATTVLHMTGYVTMALFAMLFVLVIASDVTRLVLATLRVAAAALPLPHLDVVVTSFVILGGAVLLTAVGAAQARCPATRRVDVAIDDLPEELEGYRIVQWSDVHVGPGIRRRFIQSLVDRTNDLGADAIAITGDFIDGDFAQLADQLTPVADLRSRDGVFYVTGNHEYYWRADEWLPQLTTLGIDFLKNEHRTIRRGNANLIMAGVTDPVGRGAHTQDMAAAFANTPTSGVRVLLSHRPQMAEEAGRYGTHLQLSGHTHGGQFFPFNLVIRFFQPIVAGLHRVGKTWLYVSRGTGYWGPPSRLGVGGEITVIELRRNRT
jgi:uncharacterized protein